MKNLCIDRFVSARLRAGVALGAAVLAGAAGASAAQLTSVAERLEDGRVRVALEGGLPWSAAVLRLESGAGAVVQAIVLDGDGRWERELEGFDPRATVALSFRAPTDALTHSASVAWQTFVPGRDLGPGHGIPLGAPVISEFMKDPTVVGDTAGEWIEVYNAGAFDVNLEGWALADAGSNFHVISTGGAGLIVPPGGRVVLGNNADPALNGGVAVDYKYASYTLGNGADQILLLTPGGQLADGIAYDDGVLWPDTPGTAAALDAASHDATANDDGGNWCNALTPQSPGSADEGTPGERNATCP
jgi:hypothetical protein